MHIREIAKLIPHNTSKFIHLISLRIFDPYLFQLKENCGLLVKLMYPNNALTP